jgi:SAM-dependent methyltransferase
MIDFVPHRAVWTHEKSTRFRHELFSLRDGEKNDVRNGMSGSLIRFARANGSDLEGQVLELGSRSGPLDGAHGLASLPATLSSETYSTAFVVDTIEHLPDDELGALIAELHRALRPDGSLVAVAPNEEKLQIGETVCPDCGCMFHRLQHVRSWTAVGLAAFMSACGFETVAATPWYLDQRWWKSRLITTAARTLGKRLPSLIYVGRKRVAR